MEIIQDFYSDKYKLRFYHIGKNGMSSVIRMFNMKLFDIEDIDDNSTTFAIIREPFDRFVSVFLETKKGFLAYRRNNPHLNREIDYNRLLDIYNGNPALEVDRYMDEVLKNGIYDNHQWSQVFQLNNPQHGRNIDDVDYFLDFNKLGDEIKNKINSNVDVLKLNSHSNAVKNIYSILFEKYYDRIRELRDEDFELYKKLKF